VKEGTVASMTSCPGNVEDKPLLYPLHIVTDRGEDTTKSVVFPSTATLSSERAQTGESVLRGIRITFPNGVKIWVREADSRGVYCLVHGKES